MKIRIDETYNRLYILEQEDVTETNLWRSRNGLFVYISLCPEASYQRDFITNKETLEGCFLRGFYKCHWNDAMSFKSKLDLCKGIIAIQEYCEYRQWSFTTEGVEVHKRLKLC